MSDFGKIHKGFHRHRKVGQCSNGAIGLWAKANSWCRDNRSAGVIPLDDVLRLGTREEADELVAAGLWVKAKRGDLPVAVFKDYEQWNDDVEPDTEAGNMVRKIIPESHPVAIRKQLVRKTGELLREGIEPEIMERALNLWLAKEFGPNILPNLVSEAQKEARRAATLRNTINECLKTGQVSPLKAYGHVFTPPIPPDGLSLDERRSFYDEEKKRWLLGLRERVAA
ncbi:hypothetical protein SEQ_HALENA_65 [Mycobacterium phage Halena]|uniref:Helix-turn-helix DNA binding domain protein n=1 Tax=Mycobacterium phage Halena TaxID=2517952 RepID=A0A482JAV0_9CAUD|nr:hypothetical protein SEA_APPLETREE2_66 [Mycobacterium phage Appletree2]QBP29848.1 hypothetical protein SEQ_HALENA_65 [Mycobacterium phage Halena]UEM46350.1 hypothetical protein SEA_ENCELADUS_64 [Mycobacterium phage Enceladus]WMI34660.1 hypothetical protein SEA_CALM_68 [Mycobacterium phage Calm]